MPGWLLRIFPQIGLGIAVIAAIGWLDHAGYRRAMAERDTRDARLLGQMQAELRRSEQRLAVAIDAAAGDYERQRAALARTGSALQPIILREIAHDPHLSDAASGLTPGLLEAVNRARAAGTCAAAAAGSSGCALPAPAASQGNGDR